MNQKLKKKVEKSIKNKPKFYTYFEFLEKEITYSTHQLNYIRSFGNHGTEIYLENKIKELENKIKELKILEDLYYVAHGYEAEYEENKKYENKEVKNG